MASGLLSVPELVDGTAELVVAIVAAAIEHVVARVVGQHTLPAYRCPVRRWAVVPAHAC
jgi:hypothetical protein